MDLSRRGFLRAATKGVGLTTAFGFDVRPALAQARELKISRTTQTHSICPYCAVACSVIIHTLGDKARNVTPTVVHVEGDPDSPINRGTLCSKGITLKQFIVNDQRLTRPLYRAPGSTQWKGISWDEAIERMARLLKTTRDKGFERTDGQGRVVNRLTNLAIIGGCTDTNEINYLLGKFRFGLGVLACENQERMARAHKGGQRLAGSRAERLLKGDALILSQHRLAGSEQAVALADQRRRMGDFVAARFALFDGPAQEPERLQEEGLNEVRLQAPRLGPLHLLPDLLDLRGIHAALSQRALFEEFLAAVAVGEVVHDPVKPGFDLGRIPVPNGLDEQIAKPLFPEKLAQNVEHPSAKLAYRNGRD